MKLLEQQNHFKRRFWCPVTPWCKLTVIYSCSFSVTTAVGLYAIDLDPVHRVLNSTV